MRHMKKLTAFILSALMVVAMAIPAFAADITSKPNASIEITPTEASVHDLLVYQIFTGDLELNDTGAWVLTNERWGKNGTGTLGAEVDEATLKRLTDANNLSDAEKLNVITNFVTLDENVYARISYGEKVDVAPGYYFIMDDTEHTNETAQHAHSLYMVQVADDVKITAKSSMPTLEKKVQDNDTANDLNDSADYDIGDAVPFQLTATLGNTYHDYQQYKLVFHDTQSAGLSKPDSVTVTTSTGATISNAILDTNPTDGCSFHVTINDLKTADAALGDNGTVTVNYTATLNDSAVIGAKGNENKARLEFSNDPNVDEQGNPKETTDETPDDHVVVFTYKVDIDKVNAGQQPLAGAEFTLTKADGETVAVVKFDKDGKPTEGTDATCFTFAGLDAGTYTLTETVVPSGYNGIEPITFTIDATHSTEWAGTTNANGIPVVGSTPVLSALTVTGNGTNGWSTTVADGVVSGTVVNRSGTILPTTGGMGTTLFYVLGSVLVIGAGVLLITKKRMSAE